MCMFLKLKLYFAEMVDLVSLTYLAAGHVMFDNYAVTYVDQ